MSAFLIILVGGLGLGFGTGVIVGYFLGRRTKARESQQGFTVIPVHEKEVPETLGQKK